jgi:phage shock protein C
MAAVGDRLYRSTTDRSLAGVAGGLAAYLGVDPSIVRVAWVLLAIVTGGLAAVVYIVMAIVVPEAPPGWAGRGPGPAPWSSAAGPWAPPAGGDAGVGASAGDGGMPGEPAASGWQRPDAPAWGAVPPPGSQAGPAPGAGSAGIVFGAILIVVGAWFLVRQYVRIDWDIVWPVIVIGLGALLIAGAMRRQ